MDQQTTQFQTIECVVSDRVHARSRSSQKECHQLISPKQNFVVVRQQAQLGQITNCYKQTEVVKQHIQPTVKVHEIVKVVDHREEVDHWRSKCQYFEKQVQELSIELGRLRSQPEKVTYIEDTHKIAELERQLVSYQSEINRLSILVREGTIESEQWKTKYSHITSQIQIFQNSHSELERIKKLSMENEQYLQNEVQRLNLLVQQSQQQMQQLQQTIIEIKKYEQLYVQQQATQNQLANELERTTGVLRQKSDEYEQFRYQHQRDTDSLQKRIRDQDAEIKEMRARENNYTLQIEKLSRDLSDLSERYSTETRSKNEELHRLQSVTQTLQIAVQDTSKYQEYEMRSKMLADELSILNQRLKNKQEELDRLKSSNTQLQLQLNDYQKYSEYESKYHSLYQEYDRVNNSLRLKLEENDHLRSCIAKLQITLNDKNQIQDFENKIALLSQEIERLHQSLRTKLDEIDRLKMENQQYQNQVESYRLQIQSDQSYQQKVALLTTEIERLTMQLRTKNEEIEKIRSTLSHFQFTESQKIKELEQKNLVYSNEIDRMSNLIKLKMNDSENYSQKFKDVSQKYVLACSENERLNSVLRSIQGSQEERQVLTEKISTITQELDSWKQQFIQLNREFHKNQEALILANAELDSIKNKRTVTTTTTNITGGVYKSEYSSTSMLEQENYLTKDTRKSGPLFQIGTLTHRNI